ncbi:glycosyltransferase [Aggregicoccus sp. 17bor-14]|uniref:glycosyltransferase n=1 Tax=Myxococcaceae TaxID=31 RepID=UPI00129CC36A|nr:MULTISPECIES: glycosyltransferase [Myxococcaceae]MBF5046383.1 glycosyltransferase [Simulacricoccus sp. 17bor-14]MRI92103.1 glycosyltransferase [Aggregicoccus sp. 17bor-14]
MLTSLSLTLLALAAVGLVALAVQLAVTLLCWRRAPAQPPRPVEAVGISVLKPLCGVDDDLEENLASFAALDYPHFEVVLGVKDRSDPAYAVARRAVARWPTRFRLALQHGEPGFNPKVNQLITLADAARHDLLVVSDSNVRVGPSYLWEVAHAFGDPEVGCLTHPVLGVGERRLGSLLDNLHLASSVAPGMLAAKELAGRDLVVGKSMALRREDLEQLGGFFSVKDVLAEDYVIGAWVTRQLGKRVVVAASPVFNVSQDKSVGAFFRRYARWSIIHRTAVSPLTSLAQALLNPAPLALLALLLSPSPRAAAACASVTALKLAMDLLLFHALRGERLQLAGLPRLVAAGLLKDALLAVTWTRALTCRSVEWRGQRLRVLPGSRLVAPAGLPSAAALPLPSPEDELLAS